MCNLYRVRSTTAEVAAWVGAADQRQFNLSDEVYPGTPGLVAIERNGARELRAMTWGFPLILKAMRENAARRGVAARPKPVNNVADVMKPMWRGIAARPEWRCLIPVTAFAEAEGPKGAMTRTWISLADRPLFAWAGFWRESAEWGDVYTGLMTDANDAVRAVHTRMPVLLHPYEHETWLRGSLEDVVAFQQRSFPAELVAIERTPELWVKRRLEGNDGTRALL